jgi:tRNA-binding protein
MNEISWSDFERVDMRVGTVVRAEPFPEARKPAYKLWIDLGPLGERRSSAQITDRYRPEDLLGRQVVCVVNFPPKRIGAFLSEVLVLGAYVDDRTVVLLRPDQDVERGSAIG